MWLAPSPGSGTIAWIRHHRLDYIDRHHRLDYIDRHHRLDQAPSPAPTIANRSCSLESILKWRQRVVVHGFRVCVYAMLTMPLSLSMQPMQSIQSSMLSLSMRYHHRHPRFPAMPHVSVGDACLPIAVESAYNAAISPGSAVFGDKKKTRLRVPQRC